MIKIPRRLRSGGFLLHRKRHYKKTGRLFPHGPAVLRVKGGAKVAVKAIGRESDGEGLAGIGQIKNPPFGGLFKKIIFLPALRSLLFLRIRRYSRARTIKCTPARKLQKTLKTHTKTTTAD